MALLQPKEITLDALDGTERRYIMHKIPAIQAREIITQYPISAIPKLGDYKRNEELMLKLMSYVAVTLDGDKTLPLTTRALVDNHIPDFEILMRLEAMMIDYNCSFFTKGTGLIFFDLIAQKASPWISKILTALSDQSSPKDTPPSTNSDPSTP